MNIHLKIKKAMWLVFAFGWWGVLYPELTLTEDTFRIVWSDEENCKEVGKTEESEDLSATQIYYKLLSGSSKEIKIKSKLLEVLTDYFEKG